MYIAFFSSATFGNVCKRGTTHFERVENAQLTEESKCRQATFDIGQEIMEIQKRIQERIDKN